MTREELIHGQELLNQIDGLKTALITVNSDNFFKISSGSCSRYDADPFLAELHIGIKSNAITSINARINLLEKKLASIGQPSVYMEDINKAFKCKTHD